LQAGADVNVRDNENESALTLALKQGHLDTAELLRGAGARQ